MKWKTKLNEQIEKNVALNSRFAESVADGILESVAEGLQTLRKKSSLHLPKMLSLKVKTSYREKLETLRNLISQQKCSKEHL